MYLMSHDYYANLKSSSMNGLFMYRFVQLLFIWVFLTMNCVFIHWCSYYEWLSLFFAAIDSFVIRKLLYWCLKNWMLLFTLEQIASAVQLVWRCHLGPWTILCWSVYLNILSGLVMVQISLISVNQPACHQFGIHAIQFFFVFVTHNALRWRF
jgi:hypothetical protein